jgi:hypothetical protein
MIGPAVPPAPKELRIGHNAIDALIAACDALSLQATQAGAQTLRGC